MEVAYRADSSRPVHGFFGAMNQLATTRYEKRAGLGRLVIASPSSPAVDRMLLLERDVPVKETRTLRKLLEMSSNDGAALLTNGSVAYGLGRVNESYDASSESVFEAVVSGPGSWDLRHAGIQLMSVSYGAPQLPAQPLSRARFVDTARRIFAPFGGSEEDRLWELAMAAADAEHGTMLVVSAHAATEANRLRGQALIVQPTELDIGVIRQLTKIDGGARRPERSGRRNRRNSRWGCDSEGDRARGARYNSAVRYMATAPKGTVIALVSEDGMLDLLPRMRPQLARTQLAAMLDDIRAAAAIGPVNGEQRSIG
jgi:hypothetical protein